MTAGKTHWVLSGGLASGKSKVRELLESHGIVTIDADDIGHGVLDPQGPAFAEVAQRWPEVVLDGEISRSALASIVFNDREELATLESITHPHIFDKIRAQVEKIESTVVVEIPLIGHRLGEDWARIVVDSRDEVRFGRAVARGMSDADVRARMASQHSRSVWLAAADLVIPNHGSEQDLGHVIAILMAAEALSQ